MNKMQEFTQSIGFVTFFVVTVLLLSMTVGEGPTIMFLWLVLLSMSIINYDAIIDLLGRFSTV